MKTYSVKASDIKPEWQVIDASGQTLGRLASEAARLLLGKHKPMYAPHLNTGDFVVIVNADKVKVSGDKAKKKEYYRHSGYIGGLKVTIYEDMLAKHPTRVIEHAIRGMLPRNRLGAAIFGRLKVYAGPEHPHQAQVKKIKETKQISAEVEMKEE